MLRIVHRGNHQLKNGVLDLPPWASAPWSTECHVAASLDEMGHEVIRHQENEVSWQETEAEARRSDLLIWTPTRGYSLNWPEADAYACLAALKIAGVPTVMHHLDLWMGLERQTAIHDCACFSCSVVMTADGDHDTEWAAAGVRHVWLPPAVYGAECYPGTPRDRYKADVVFVGSWRHYGHPEWWPQRKALLDWLKSYRAHVEFWPKGPAVRGSDLNDLYASAKIAVGDSALWTTSTRYMSDRIFESVGRGAFSILPAIPAAMEMLTDGTHCRFWSDLDQLQGLLDHYLEHDDERETIRAQGQAWVREHHTYRNRMETLLATVGLTESAATA